MTTTPDVVTQLLETLSELGIRYMVGGSFASSAWGQPRQTNDLDLELVLVDTDLSRLHEATRADYLGSVGQMEEAVASGEEFPSFQLLHMEETFKIDFFPVKPDAYVVASFARAREFELSPGKRFPLKSPEDILITKLRWFRLGNMVSDRQWNDIVLILEIQSGHLDDAYLDYWCDHFGLLNELGSARSQALPGRNRDGR